MASGEGRLGRWSRLKQKGGADSREESAVEDTRVAEKQAVAEAEPEAFNLPGGVRVRHFVPAMAPLAPSPEDDDDRLTRGIGHVEESGEPDIEALKDGPDDEQMQVSGAFEAQDDLDRDLYAGIEEEELTKEQQEVVSTLPPLESLTGESDFTPFMREGVPEIIKRKAMRILWRANPLFGFRDEMNDYDEDYNIVHKIIDSSFGSYQVGRGHLTEEELQEMMPEEAKRAFDEDEEDVEEDVEEELIDSEEQLEEAGTEIAEQPDEATKTEPGSNQNTSETSGLSDTIDPDDDTDTDDTDDIVQ